MPRLAVLCQADELKPPTATFVSMCHFLPPVEAAECVPWISDGAGERDGNRARRRESRMMGRQSRKPVSVWFTLSGKSKVWNEDTWPVCRQQSMPRPLFSLKMSSFSNFSMPQLAKAQTSQELLNRNITLALVPSNITSSPRLIFAQDVTYTPCGLNPRFSVVLLSWWIDSFICLH